MDLDLNGSVSVVVKAGDPRQDHDSVSSIPGALWPYSAVYCGVPLTSRAAAQAPLPVVMVTRIWDGIWDGVVGRPATIGGRCESKRAPSFSA